MQFISAHGLRRLRRQAVDHPQVGLAVAVMFALAGLLLLVASSAATVAVPSEAESGRLAGNVAAGDGNGASGAAAVKFGAAVTGSGSILMEDDFNGTAGSLPDQAKWGKEYCPGQNMAGSWGEIRCGADEKLDGQGHLALPATPQYGTALMATDGNTFQYGTFSAWLKLPSQAGYWPAFWLVNPDAAKGTSGEIDIIEGYTTWLTAYHTVVHSWGPNGQVWAGPDDIDEAGTDLSASFHKYSTRIEPGKVSFYFDDKPIGTTITRDSSYVGGKPWPFGPDSPAKHDIILDLAVGGAGGQQTPATQPGNLLVDRIEVRGL
jgi:hypothetical protein